MNKVLWSLVLVAAVARAEDEKRLVVVAAKSGTKAPLVDLGETKLRHGARVEHVAVCGGGRVVSMDDSKRVYEWKSDGTFLRELFAPRTAILTDLACRGEVAVIAADAEQLVLRGDQIIGRASYPDPLAVAIDASGAIVAAQLDDGSEAVAALDDHGAHVLWKPTGNGGLHDVVRRDLFVSGGDHDLVWATPAKSVSVPVAAPVAAVADVGDGIAVVDDRGAVRVLSGPSWPAPLFTIDVAAAGQPSSIAGDRTWLAIGTRGGFLVQARRGGKPSAPLRVLADEMYQTVYAIALDGDAWLAGGDNYRLERVPRGAAAYTPPGRESVPRALAFDGKWLAFARPEALVIASSDGKQVASLPVDDWVSHAGMTSTLVWATTQDHLFRWKRPKLEPLPAIELPDPMMTTTDDVLVMPYEQIDATSGKRTKRKLPVDSCSDLFAGADLVVSVPTCTEHAPIAIVTRGGAVVAKVPQHHERSTTVVAAVSRDGKLVAIAEDEEVRVWSRATGKVTDVGAHRANVSALAFAPDGRLASGDWHGHVRVWKLGDKAPQIELTNHHGWVHVLAWAGTQLASIAGDQHVQVVDLR